MNYLSFLKMVLKDGRRSIVRNFPHAVGNIWGLDSGFTYWLFAAAVAFRNGTEIKDPLYSDSVPVTTSEKHLILRIGPVYQVIKISSKCIPPAVPVTPKEL